MSSLSISPRRAPQTSSVNNNAPTGKGAGGAGSQGAALPTGSSRFNFFRKDPNKRISSYTGKPKETFTAKSKDERALKLLEQLKNMNGLSPLKKGTILNIIYKIQFEFQTKEAFESNKNNLIERINKLEIPNLAVNEFLENIAYYAEKLDSNLNVETNSISNILTLLGSNCGKIQNAIGKLLEKVLHSQYLTYPDVRKAVEDGADMNAPARLAKEGTVFTALIIHTDIEITDLLRLAPDFNVTDHSGNTTLMVLINNANRARMWQKRKQYYVLNHFIKCTSVDNINFQNRDGETAFSLLVQDEIRIRNRSSYDRSIFPEFISQFLEVGAADPAIKNNAGKDIYDYLEDKDSDICVAILKYRDNKTYVDSAGNSLLMRFASKYKYLLMETMIGLLEQSRNLDFINHQNEKGETALMIAVQNNDSKTVSLLVDKGANIELENKEGKTCADFAKTREMKRALMLEVVAQGAGAGSLSSQPFDIKKIEKEIASQIEKRLLAAFASKEYLTSQQQDLINLTIQTEIQNMMTNSNYSSSATRAFVPSSAVEDDISYTDEVEGRNS